MDVSVVIPCYNAGPHLAQAIGSVLDQTSPPDEVIVVDDGSTDDSLAVARRFETAVPGVVRVVSRRSRMASRTRNIGASLATGSAIMFLDADDVIAPDTLAALGAALERRPGSVAICPWFRLDLVDGRWRAGPPSCKPRRPGEDPLAAWLTGWYHPPCSVLWSREAFERTGRWDELCPQNDDGDLMMRALAWGIPLVEATGGAGYYRRMAEPGTTLSGARFTEEGLRARIRVVRKISMILGDAGELDRYRAPLATALMAIAADAAACHVALGAAVEAEAACLGRWRPTLRNRVAGVSDRRRRLGRRLRRRLDGTGGSARPVPRSEVRFGAERAAEVLSRTGPVNPAPGRPPLPEAPNVSVVIPTFNRSELLSRAIGSVLAQTSSDFEVLVVDDGSTEDIEGVVNSFGDDRLRYVRQGTNQGVGAARNRGMREARGELLAFLDSDDEWFPAKLALQVERFSALPDVGLVYGGVEDDRGVGHRRVHLPTARGDVSGDLLVKNVVHGMSSVVIRRCVVAGAGFFDEDLPAMEDYDYWLRVSRLFHFDFVEEPVVRYHDPRGVGDDDRRSRVAAENHDARMQIYRRYRSEMGSAGVRHRYLAYSAQRELRAPGRLGPARRLALRAAWWAPTSREVHRLLLGAFVREPLRRSALARWGRRQLSRAPSDVHAMRILMYTSTSRRNAGGVQNVYLRLATGLRDRGYTVVTAWGEPLPGGRAAPSAGDPGEVFKLRQPEKGRMLRSSFASVRSFACLGVGLWRSKPDLVNVHFVREELVHFLAWRRVLRFKLVVSVHGSDVLRPTERDAATLPRLLRAADAVTTVSAELADLVLQHPGVDPSKVHVIPNGVDFAFWSSLPRDWERAAYAPAILTVGRLTPGHKGQDVLLRALVGVRQAIPGARLVVVGEGQWRGELESLRDELGLTDAASFVGELDPPEIRMALSTTSVFALPSRREGMPLVLLEAMCAGAPVVATPVGGVPDVLVPGTGLLVATEDSEALAEALVRVLSNHDLAQELGAGAQRRAQEFAASAVEIRYEELFATLLGGDVSDRSDRPGDRRELPRP